MALRGRHRATAAAIAALKTIRGKSAGYWLDLGGRVFRREVRPEDVEGVELPFAVVPKIRNAPSYEDLEERGMIVTWLQPILVYVEERGVGLDDLTAPDDLDKAHDDVIRAIMLDWTLGGTCEVSSIAQGGSEEGAVLGEDYGEVEIILQLKQYIGRADLGPLATA